MKFKSINQRLIFACLIASIFIYGISYIQIRQVLERGVTSWMTDVVQSRLDFVAMNMETIFSSIENESRSIGNFNSSDEFISRTSSLLQRESYIQAILWEDSSGNRIQSILKENKRMTSSEINILSASCQNLSSTPSWIYNDRTSSFTYCSQSDQFYEVSALFQPARIIGGDLYDFFPLPENKICINYYWRCSG